jgi:hypothetical protein
MIIDGSEIRSGDWDARYLNHATIVVVHHMNSSHAYDVHQTLLEHREYALLDHNPEHQSGYTIFKRAAI